MLDGLAGLSRSQVLACCALTHRMLHAPAVIRVSILVQGAALRAARGAAPDAAASARAGRAASGRSPRGARGCEESCRSCPPASCHS